MSKFAKKRKGFLSTPDQSIVFDDNTACWAYLDQLGYAHLTPRYERDREVNSQNRPVH